MITASTNLQNVFKQNSSIKASVGCTIEYNMNMLTNLSATSISGPAYATINSKEAFKKIFPLESIIKPRRPEYAGIKYAIFGDISRDYNAATKKGGDYIDPRNSTYPINYRTYYSGIDTIYKYWISSKGQGGTITVTYPKSVVTNKIVAKFEVAHATPSTWQIYGTIGGVETLLASGTSADIPGFGSANPGVLEIYYTGSTWSKVKSSHNLGSNITITALKLIISGVTNKYVGVIEFSPRWKIDVSDKISNMSITKEASDTSDGILPVGQVTSNSINITLVDFNQTSKNIIEYQKDNTFTIDATKTYLYKQVQINPYFKIFHDNGALGSGSDKYDEVNQGYFYIDNFSIDEFGIAQIFALDSAKILQETICPPILCEVYSATAVIRRLLDNIGFTNYNFNLTDTDKSIIVPNYWWTSDEKTVWQAIQEICRDSQMTAVVDENNILQFYSREYMYSSRTTNWTFTSELIDTTTLPNIVSLEKVEFPSANQIKIIWRSATTSNYQKDAFILWKSSEKTLGAAVLAEDLPAIDVQNGVPAGGNPKQYITLAVISEYTPFADDLIIYEFNGYLGIGEEIIEFDALEYSYVPITSANPTNYKGEYAAGTTYQIGNEVTYNGIIYVAKTITVGNVPTNKTYWDQVSIIVDITGESDIAKYRALSQPGAQYFQPTKRYRIKNRKAFGTSFPKDANGNPTSHKASTSSQLSGWDTYEVKYV